ncbi:hypothetical protein [Ralstonia solanacearum]|uniref:hypothetical protein n=1 Tax=Ralstonia solanacearum TaxID=305 RepID=UPI003CC5D4BB
MTTSHVLSGGIAERPARPASTHAACLQARLFVAHTESEALQQAASAREKMPPIPGRAHHRQDPQSVTGPIVHPMRETGAGHIIGFFAGNPATARRPCRRIAYCLGAQVIPVLNRMPRVLRSRMHPAGSRRDFEPCGWPLRHCVW